MIIVLGGVITCAVTILVGACSLDWSVRTDNGTPKDSGADQLVDAADVAVDTNVPDNYVPERDGGDAAVCPGLEADMLAKRDAARKCLTAGVGCARKIVDQCSCEVAVYEPDSGATQSYEAALATYVASGCVPICAACGPQPVGSCIFKAAIGKYECYPP
jgi:hypothetical protein